MMYAARQRQGKGGHRRGTTAVFLAILLPVVLAVAAYSINVAYMELSRTETQIVMDISARGAGRTFAVTRDKAQAIQTASRLMEANPLSKGSVRIEDAELELGVTTRYSEWERYQFGEGEDPNALRLRASGNVRIPMLFPTGGDVLDFRPIKTTVSSRAEVEIALVMDRSGSMAFSAGEESGLHRPMNAPPTWFFGGPVPPNSRWLDASYAVQEFLGALDKTPQSEQVALITYGLTSSRDVALTNQYASILGALNFHATMFGGGPTNTGSGLEEGAQALADRTRARTWAARILILLSDGKNTVGAEPEGIAAWASRSRVTVHTVSFSAEADVERMEQIARAGNGKHYHAVRGSDLVAAFRDIVTRLPTLVTE